MKNLQAAKTVARDVYAWPGGYPLYLVTSDGGCLCPACVKSEWRNIVSASLTNHKSSGWHPAGADINYEDADLYCDHCGKQIEAAYT
jgi:hypothetical protein